METVGWCREKAQTWWGVSEKKLTLIIGWSDVLAEMTPDAMFDLFDEIRDPVLMAGDVADASDCSPKTARRKLRELEADSRVDSRESRRRIFWWWTVDER